MTLSKFIRLTGEDSTITEWTPPVIEKDGELSADLDSKIDINTNFVDVDFSKQLDASKNNLDKDFIKSRDQGYDDGYKIGKHEAESLLENDVKESLHYFKSNIAKLHQPLRALESGIEKELAELAILIAEKMIADHIRHKPETIINLIAEATKLLPNTDRALTISINPADLSFIKENAESLEEFNCKFTEDENLQRGGMLIQSDDINIDLSLEKRMHDLINQFLGNN